MLSLFYALQRLFEMRPYLIDCVRDMVEIGKKYNAKLVCAGKISVIGHPHHSLYLRKDEVLKEFAEIA